MTKTDENWCLFEHSSGTLNQEKPRVTKELQMCAFHLSQGPKRPIFYLDLGPEGLIFYSFPCICEESP